MEEKMASAEETKNASELKDMNTFLRMKKYYREDRQATTPTFSPLYKSCTKEFKILFNNKPTPIDRPYHWPYITLERVALY